MASLQHSGGRSVMSTMTTGRARAGVHVLGCPGVVALVVEEGEGKARSAATGTVDVCVCVPCASGRVSVYAMDWMSGMDAGWSGSCTYDLGPGKAGPGSVV